MNPIKQLPKQLPATFRAAEYERGIWTSEPDAETTLESMLDPAYWAHVAYRLKRHDRVEVIPKGGAWFAELLVLSVDTLAARVAVLRKIDLQAPAAAGVRSDTLSVKLRGEKQWCVVRGSDKAVLAENFQTKAEAEAWIAEQGGAAPPARAA